jgi:RimJ/RimL family protein N-acetyltransferase
VGKDLNRVAFPEPPLAGGEIVLRPWDRRDADLALAAGSDPLIARYRYSLPRTGGAARQWIAATEAERIAGTRIELAITRDEVPVGSVALAEIAHHNAMVRFWLLPHARGRGFASGAVSLLADWAFSRLDIGRLAAVIEVDNDSSQSVVKRCGFVEEGRLRRHMVGHDGQRVDTLLYGLLPEDLRHEPGPTIKRT